ncbi:MAG: hypothetical protein H7Y11_04610 [Armatimonadetes bacterium]|nr:hypothetical protein [Anaerolineae bacterium]
MNDSEFTPQEQALINRLANAPQPKLSPDAFAAIQVRLLAALDTPPPSPLNAAVPLLTAVIVVVSVVAGVVFFSNRPPEIVPTATPAPTLTATPTAQPSATPTSTATHTSTPVVTMTAAASATHTPLPTTTATPTLTATHTVEPTRTATMESTPTPTLEPVLVVEGEIQTITGNLLTVYNISITLAPDDPLLDALQIGDLVRIEAAYSGGMMLAISVTVVDNTVTVNPETGAVWRDEGNCNNPPPPWAPANGWRRRCEGGGNNGQGSGNGNQDDDDD